MIKQLTTKVVYRNPWMVVREDQVEFPNGHTGLYGVVEKTDFALIIPFDGQHLHLVKQYRYPTKSYSIEFPQGKHEDDATIDPTLLAKAELQEELGLIATKMTEIGFFHEAPGYCNQGFHLFWATEFTQGQTTPDQTEADLEHVILTPQEFEQRVSSGDITDAPTISAYGLAKIRKLL